MTPLQEIKYLAAALKQIDAGPPKALRSFWVDLAVWFGAAAIFFVIFQAGDRLHPVTSLFIAVVSGIALGFFCFYQLAAKQWPFLRRHLNRESIVGRLSELEP